MKKFLCALLAVISMTGCSLMQDMENTPTKQVEAFLDKYQTLDDNVLNDLDTTLQNNYSLTENELTNYKDFMKTHYQDLTYEIKNETIDGDTATVQTEIQVKNYSDVVATAQKYKSENESEFNDEEGVYDATKYNDYLLEKLKEVKDKTTYTIDFTLSKVDNKWSMDALNSEQESKINGLYSQ